MSDDWPGRWRSATEKIADRKEATLSNDNGILCLIEGGDEWLFMEDAPNHMTEVHP